MLCFLKSFQSLFCCARQQSLLYNQLQLPLCLSVHMPWITLFYQHCKKMISRMEQLSKTISVVPRIIFQHQHSCIHTAKILGHANEISYLHNFILTNLLRGRHFFFLTHTPGQVLYIPVYVTIFCHCSNFWSIASMERKIRKETAQ